jgi:hypothetical protein
MVHVQQPGRNDIARPLATMIAPTTGRGLISACSMLAIKSQKSISEVVAEAVFRVMDQLRPLLTVQKAGNEGSIRVRQLCLATPSGASGGHRCLGCQSVTCRGSVDTVEVRRPGDPSRPMPLSCGQSLVRV